MNNNKFFTLETEQRNRFYQVPKQFMNKNSKYFGMKADTKLIYGVLSDRNSLSIKNGWYDDDGRIYFKFNQKELSEILGMTPKTLRTKLEELESNGLLYRKRLGFKQSDNLYLLQLDYEEFEKESNVRNVENTMMGKNYPSRRVKITHQEGKKLPTNDTNINKTDINKTNLTTTIEDEPKKEVAISLEENNSSSDINLNINGITKCNIKKLKLNQGQINLLEQYVQTSEYEDINKFSYFIAKSIKAEEITINDLSKNTNNAIGKFNSKVTYFRRKNYDYNALESELSELDY